MSIRVPPPTAYDEQGRPVLQYQEKPRSNYRWDPPRLTAKQKVLWVLICIVGSSGIAGVCILLGIK